MLSKIARTTGLFALVALPIQLHSQPSSAQTSFVDCEFAGNTIWEAANDFLSVIPVARELTTMVKFGIASSKVANNVTCNSQGIGRMTLEELTRHIESVTDVRIDRALIDELVDKNHLALDKLGTYSSWINTLDEEELNEGTRERYIELLFNVADHASFGSAGARRYSMHALPVSLISGAIEFAALKLAYDLEETEGIYESLYEDLMFSALSRTIGDQQALTKTLELHLSEYSHSTVTHVDRVFHGTIGTTTTFTVLTEVKDPKGEVIHSTEPWICSQHFDRTCSNAIEAERESQAAIADAWMAEERQRVRAEVLGEEYQETLDTLEELLGSMVDDRLGGRVPALPRPRPPELVIPG